MIAAAAILVFSAGLAMLLLPKRGNAAIEKKNPDVAEITATPSVSGLPAPLASPPSRDRAPVIAESPAVGRPTPVPADLPTSVPTLRVRANTGQSPKAPPIRIYRRFKPQIDRVILDVNEAFAGANCGLNVWWRDLDEEGEELSQHLIGCAIDFQGPQQEQVAAMLEVKGWVIVRISPNGQRYRHIHAQIEAKGFLSRLGVTRDSLQA